MASNEKREILVFLMSYSRTRFVTVFFFLIKCPKSFCQIKVHTEELRLMLVFHIRKLLISHYVNDFLTSMTLHWINLNLYGCRIWFFECTFILASFCHWTLIDKLKSVLNFKTCNFLYLFRNIILLLPLKQFKYVLCMFNSKVTYKIGGLM